MLIMIMRNFSLNRNFFTFTWNTRATWHTFKPLAQRIKKNPLWKYFQYFSGKEIFLYLGEWNFLPKLKKLRYFSPQKFSFMFPGMEYSSLKPKTQITSYIFSKKEFYLHSGMTGDQTVKSKISNTPGRLLIKNFLCSEIKLIKRRIKTFS